MIFNQHTVIAEKLRAKMAVDDFLAESPSIFEIQAYVQMARNDLAANPTDLYAKHVIHLLSGDSD